MMLYLSLDITHSLHGLGFWGSLVSQVTQFLCVVIKK